MSAYGRSITIIAFLEVIDNTRLFSRSHEKGGRKMKCLVMETFNSYAVLLDEEGRFVKSGNPNYEIGDTVANPVLIRDKPLEKVKETHKLVACYLKDTS